MHTATRITLLALALPLAAQAQDPAQMTDEEKAMMAAYQAAGTPGPQHAALAATAGDYTLTVKNYPAPGTDPVVESGSATRKMSLDGRILVEEVQSTMMGTPFTGYGMTGFDNVSGRYWSTWNDSMSTGIMVSDGSCDEHKHCQFSGSWNDPITKGKVTARVSSRWTDANTEIFEMYGPGPDGKEMKMMEITYQRKQ